MKLVLDIGNTRVKASLFDNDIIVDYYHGSIDIAALEEFIKDRNVSGGMWSSVKPLSLLFENWLISKGLVQLTWQTPIPLINLYSTPKTLGMDRIAAAVGAWSLKPGNDILIVDVGTAITYDFVSSKGEYFGGNISPGKDLRFKSLHEHTGALPLVSMNGEIPLIGNSTDSAIRSGVINGIKNEFSGFVSSMREIYPLLLVFLTGGDMELLEKIEKIGTFVSENLVIQGLNSIINYNEKV
jgi:type III pantothenate kinase